ncbi:MAG: hypothetical protein H7308_18625 [Chthonomonadaceae bacterium]|nr:hypothetical protein [Chthonomonadaceae bacterium]
MKTKEPMLPVAGGRKLTAFDLFWFGFYLLCGFLSWRYFSAHYNRTLGVIFGFIGYGLSWMSIRLLAVWLEKHSEDEKG